MVYWSDKERGYPISGESWTKGLILYCTACPHSVSWRWSEVLKRWRVGARHGGFASLHAVRRTQGTHYGLVLGAG